MPTGNRRNEQPTGNFIILPLGMSRRGGETCSSLCGFLPPLSAPPVDLRTFFRQSQEMQKLKAVVLISCSSQRAVGSLKPWNCAVVYGWLRAGEGVDYIIVLAFAPVIQRYSLQLMTVDDLLRHALLGEKSQFRIK